jgi:transcriptional regulator GlxA family with amidase domain
MPSSIGLWIAMIKPAYSDGYEETTLFIRQICALWWRSPIDALQANALLGNMLANIAAYFLRRDAQHMQKSSELPHDIRLHRALSFARARMPKPTSVEQMAQVAGVSRTFFTKIFTEHYQCPPAKFITRTRLRAAQHALREKQKPVRDIALELQFKDAANFSSWFKRISGQIPIEWRKSINRLAN